MLLGESRELFVLLAEVQMSVVPAFKLSYFHFEPVLPYSALRCWG